MHSNLPLIIIAISATMVCVQAGVVHQSITKKLEIYQSRVSLFYDTLKNECPEDALLSGQVTKREVISHFPDNGEKASTLLEHEKALLGHIMQKIIECRKRKMEKNTTTIFPTTATTTTASTITATTTTASTITATTTTASTITDTTTTATSTASTTSATTTTATLTSTTIPTTTTTSPHPECLHAAGYTKMQIDFVRYQNPSNKQATGSQCDDRSGCNLYLEICVSAVGERNCSYYHQITEEVGQGSVITFSSDIGGSANPVILDLGERKWEGVNILVTVRDKNISQRTDDVVDEFSYDAVDSPGSPTRKVNLPSSVKKQPQSSLALALKTYCPSPLTSTTTAPTTTTTTSTTTTTTPTTTPTTTTTTLSPAQQACASAINLTESWRRDSAGSDLHPVNGDYSCDTDYMMRHGRPWFRFSGAAGNRLLDTCPPYRSCGTVVALWSSDPMPDNVGVETLISVSDSQYKTSYSCKPRSSYTRVSVMRCSTRQYDFIYRYDDSGAGCDAGFCGMS